MSEVVDHCKYKPTHVLLSALTLKYLQWFILYDFAEVRRTGCPLERE